MQCFNLPTPVAQKLDQIHREFFWKNPTTDTNLPLVAWDKIYQPKKYGGLGLRKTSAVNTAFIAKLSWKFISHPDNFWVKQMRAKYGSSEDFFSYKQKQANS